MINKKRKIFIITFIFILIILMIVLIFNSNKSKENVDDGNTVISVNSESEFYRIKIALKNFYSYINEIKYFNEDNYTYSLDELLSKAYSMLDSEYIEKYNITQDLLIKKIEEYNGLRNTDR